MPHTVHALAALVQGQVHGDGARPITRACPITVAGPGDITFIEHERNMRLLRDCKADAVVVTQALQGRLGDLAATDAAPVFVVVADPLSAFVAIARHLLGRVERPPHGIDPLASVHATAKIGPDPSIHPLAAVAAGCVIGARCQIHPGVTIGPDCRLGDDVTLHPHTVLYEGTVLGNRVTIHANSVLGADGFGYRFHQDRHVKVPHLGSVEIGDDVEIGACTTIDRGTFLATRIGAGTKIDNLVQIAHNCQIGEHNMIVAQVGIAGSVTTGSYVVLAGQVGVADHLRIHDRAVVGARSGVNRDVAEGERVMGYPARPEREAFRIISSLRHLPNVCQDVRRIKQQLGLREAG